MNDPYANLARLGLSLPPIHKPIANYVPYVRAGNLIFLSGQGPRRPDGSWITGRVGADVSSEAAYEHAKLTALSLMAVMEQAAGRLERIARIVKVLGMVNSVPDFPNHPSVINGCSDLFVEVFGESGHHARSAVGMGSLPSNITVEIEAIIEVRSD